MATEKLRFKVSADTAGFKNAMKAVGAAVTAAFAAAIKITADFEAEMAKVKAVAGATSDELKALETEARRLGKTTAYTASQVAQLEFELAKLGFTTGEIIQSAGAILNLAAALGIELADAAVLAGSTVRAFGLDVSETARVTDVLAKAASSSALDATKLTESLKYAAPIAKLYNFTIEDTVAILGTLADAGIHGTQAGTALRNIFLELDKKGITLSQALEMVNNSANPAATALELVGKRSSGALAIIAQNQGKVQGLADELYNAAGAAEKMRTEMEDTLKGDFAKLQSAASELAIAVGKELDPALRYLTQAFTEVLANPKTTKFILDFLDALKILVYDVAAGFLQIGILLGKMGIAAGAVGAALEPHVKDMEQSLKWIQTRTQELRIKDNTVDTTGTDPTSSGYAPPQRTQNTVGHGNPVSRPKVSGAMAITPRGTSNVSGIDPVNILGDLVSQQVFGQLDQFIEKIQTVEKNSIMVAESIGDAFTTMGANISTALTNSMGVFGAFLGAFIETSLKMIGQSIQESLTIAAQEKAKTSIKAAGAAARSAIAAGETSVSLAASAAQATGNAVVAASETAKSTGPAAAFLLPALIAGAVAAVGAAFSGLGRGGGSVGGSRNVSASISSTPFSATPTVNQGAGGSQQLVATVRGQDLRFALQNANAINGQTT